jgi:hypothetical protein
VAARARPPVIHLLRHLELRAHVNVMGVPVHGIAVPVAELSVVCSRVSQAHTQRERESERDTYAYTHTQATLRQMV